MSEALKLRQHPRVDTLRIRFHMQFLNVQNPYNLFCRCNNQRLGTVTVAVSEEKNALALALSSFRWLDPVAHSHAAPHSLQESNATISGICAIMLAHNFLDGFAGLVRIVEWDSANVVMKNVSLDDAVEKFTADETEFTIDCRCGATCEVPDGSVIMRKTRIGMLEVGDGNWVRLQVSQLCPVWAVNKR